MSKIISLKPIFRKQTLLLVWILVITLAFAFFDKLWVPLVQYPEMIKEFIASFWIIGPIVYIVIYAIRPLVFFPATLLTMVSGLIFGPVLWVLYTIVWENISANVSFVTWRYFWKEFLEKMATKGSIFKFADCKFKENWFIAVLTMRLIFFPFDLVWYMSGACNVSQREFALWTFIWILPWLITFVVLWASFTDPRNLIFAWIFFVFWILLSKYLKNKNYCKLNYKQ